MFLGRLLFLVTGATLLFGLISEDDEDSKNPLIKAKNSVEREVLSAIQVYDPILWTSTPRLLTWLQDFSAALVMMHKTASLTHDTPRYKRGVREGELKMWKSLDRLFVPASVKHLRKITDPPRKKERRAL